MTIEWRTVGRSKIKTLGTIGKITITLCLQYKKRVKEWTWAAWDIAPDADYKLLYQSRVFNQIFQTDEEARKSAQAWLDAQNARA